MAEVQEIVVTDYPFDCHLVQPGYMLALAALRPQHLPLPETLQRLVLLTVVLAERRWPKGRCQVDAATVLHRQSPR